MQLTDIYCQDIQNIIDNLITDEQGCVYYRNSTSGVTKVRVWNEESAEWRWHTIQIKKLLRMVHGEDLSVMTYRMCETKGCCNPEHYVESMSELRKRALK